MQKIEKLFVETIQKSRFSLENKPNSVKWILKAQSLVNCGQDECVWVTFAVNMPSIIMISADIWVSRMD